jgi:hypothetical protein
MINNQTQETSCCWKRGEGEVKANDKVELMASQCCLLYPWLPYAFSTYRRKQHEAVFRSTMGRTI